MSSVHSTSLLPPAFCMTIGHSAAGGRPALLCPDVGRLDNWPPLFNLGLLESVERFGRLLLAWRDFLPEVGEPFAHGGIGQRLDDRGIEFRNDVRRRRPGRPKRGPNRNVKSRQTCLVHGRDVWRR